MYNTYNKNGIIVIVGEDDEVITGFYEKESHIIAEGNNFTDLVFQLKKAKNAFNLVEDYKHNSL